MDMAEMHSTDALCSTMCSHTWVLSRFYSFKSLGRVKAYRTERNVLGAAMPLLCDMLLQMHTRKRFIIFDRSVYCRRDAYLRVIHRPVSLGPILYWGPVRLAVFLACTAADFSPATNQPAGFLRAEQIIYSYVLLRLKIIVVIDFFRYVDYLFYSKNFK